MTNNQLQRQVTLLETLDRLLNKGVVVAGDVTLSVADVDLIHLSLRLLLTSVETAQKLRVIEPMTVVQPEEAARGARGTWGHGQCP